MANQICNPETTTHNPTNDANTVNTGSYKARLIASIYPWDKSVYMSKLSQVIHLISSKLRSSLGLGVGVVGCPLFSFSSLTWPGIFLLLSFPTQSFAQDDTYRNRFINQKYADSVWEDYPTIESFIKYYKQWTTPKTIEIYAKWHKKFGSTHKKQSQESLDYLAKQPLGESIKKVRDIDLAYKTWLQDFQAYALCVEAQYQTKQPFLAFKDFQKTKAKYVHVNCNGEVKIKCSETLNDGHWYDIDKCKVFPDWRYEDATSWVSRYATFEKNGIHAVVPD